MGRRKIVRKLRKGVRAVSRAYKVVKRSKAFKKVRRVVGPAFKKYAVPALTAALFAA